MWADNAHIVTGRRFDQNDVPFGPEFPISSVSTSADAMPAVGSDAAGNFVVTYNVHSSSVWGERLDSTGAPRGPGFEIFPYGSDEVPERIAVAPSGAFMALNTNQNDARVYDSSGTPIGPPFSVDPSGDYSGAAADADGNFIVAWQGPDFGDLTGRRFDPTGQPDGSTFALNQTPFDRSGIAFNHPDIAVDPNGDFVVVWANYYYPYPDGTRYISGIFGRRFAVCGDGRVGPLACDDGNNAVLDGCSDHCQVETCAICGGGPSACATIPGCTVVCSNAAAIDDKAILTIKKILPPAGDEAITFRGRILNPPLAPGAYDPSVEGAEVVLTGTDVLYQRATPTPIPPGLVGSGCGLLDGWKVSGRAPNFSYTYKNLTNALPPACTPGSANGVRVVKFKDKLAKDGTVQFQVSVKNATLPPVPGAPLVATVVLGQSPTAGMSGRCARIRFGTGYVTGSTARYYP